MLGFNSFTQQLCIDNAVVSPQGHEAEEDDEDSEEDSSDDANDGQVVTKGTNPSKREAPKRTQQKKRGPIAQEVSYKASIIDKVTDVTSEMNVSSRAFSLVNELLTILDRSMLHLLSSMMPLMQREKLIF